MTSSSNETLERIARRVPVPGSAYERMLHRRDRKRRNQRIAAGAVGIAVFVAAIGLVTTFGSTDRTQPGASGGTVTDPTATGPTSPDLGWDGFGFPPEGAIPSTPKGGELIDHYGDYLGDVYVYADGRVIWSAGSPPSGRVIYERRLTAEGVELVRSDVIDVADIDVRPPFVYGVPETAWAEAEARLYVPSRYAFCFFRESGESVAGTRNGSYEYPSAVLDFFPSAARAILRGEVSQGPECSSVTTEEARTLDQMLTDVRLEDAEGDRIFWEVAPILPHRAPLTCLACY